MSIQCANDWQIRTQSIAQHGKPVTIYIGVGFADRCPVGGHQ